jgi:hypothetical protein
VNVYLILQLTCLLLSAICCCRLCLFRVLLDACPFCFLQYTALTAFCNCSLFFLFTVRLKECPSPTLQWSMPHFSCCYKPSPLQAHWGRWHFSGQLVYLQFHEGLPLPHSLKLREPCPLCYVSFFFLSCLFIIQFVFFFLFFPWVGVSLSSRLCWSGPGLFVGILRVA